MMMDEWHTESVGMERSTSKSSGPEVLGNIKGALVLYLGLAAGA